MRSWGRQGRLPAQLVDGADKLAAEAKVKTNRAGYKTKDDAKEWVKTIVNEGSTEDTVREALQNLYDKNWSTPPKKSGSKKPDVESELKYLQPAKFPKIRGGFFLQGPLVTESVVTKTYFYFFPRKERPSTTLGQRAVALVSYLANPKGCGKDGNLVPCTMMLVNTVTKYLENLQKPKGGFEKEDLNMLQNVFPATEQDQKWNEYKATILGDIKARLLSLVNMTDFSSLKKMTTSSDTVKDGPKVFAYFLRLLCVAMGIPAVIDVDKTGIFTSHLQALQCGEPLHEFYVKEDGVYLQHHYRSQKWVPSDKVVEFLASEKGKKRLQYDIENTTRK